MFDAGVYFPEVSAGVFHSHLFPLFRLTLDQLPQYTDINGFLESNHQTKIACFQFPYPYNANFDQIIDRIYDQVDSILILVSELHGVTVDFMKKYDRPKIEYFICGFLNTQLHHSRVHRFMDWFIGSRQFYRDVNPAVLYQLTPNQPKPLMFDALLGRKKSHRDQAYEYIRSHNMLDRGIVTYLNSQFGHDFDSVTDSNWLWEDGITEQETVNWTVDQVRYYGHRMSLSQVVPISIYNRTAYSLVCETTVDNRLVFFTEKTVKPILARRLFVLLGSYRALEKLRLLGFRTFDGIIDEKYDLVENTQERHELALDQLQWLCYQDQATILNKVTDIVDHNYNHMITYDWHNQFLFPFSRPFRQLLSL